MNGKALNSIHSINKKEKKINKKCTDLILYNKDLKCSRHRSSTLIGNDFLGNSPSAASTLTFLTGGKCTIVP